MRSSKNKRVTWYDVLHFFIFSMKKFQYLPKELDSTKNKEIEHLTKLIISFFNFT